MASSLSVMTASRSIFESVGYKAERLTALKYSDPRRFIPAEEMDVGSLESSEDEEESDEEELEEDCPGLVLQFELETLSMILKLWLRRIHLTEQDQRKNLQDVEHKIYKVQEEVINPFKAFLASNKSKDLEADLPMLHHYNERLEEACQILVEEKNRVNFQIPKEDRTRLNEYTRCCSLLGLKLDFLDRLEEMPSSIRDHRTLCSWIVIFLRNNYNTLSLTEKNSPNEKQLYTIGFDPLSLAVETILARAGSMQQHIDACEWAEIFIKDEFKYNVLLSQQSTTFPFRSDKTNEWFEWHNEDDHCHVNIVNIVTKKSESSIASRSMLRNFQLEDQQHTVLFHGTDHESANDILNGRGIHLGAGRTQRDFSSGAGFYLTKHLDDALSWACSTTVKPAILVFRVALAFLNNKARKLNLNQDDACGRWREIVTSFRLDKPTAKLRHSLIAYDLIEGPLAARRSGPSNGGELVFKPKPFSYQMCLISEDFADEFRETLHSILFYDIY